MEDRSIARYMLHNFLGEAPTWYKYTIVIFLIINPIIFYINPFVAGWVLIAEFIFTLAAALKCYPLPPGGLLAIEAVIIGMTTTENVYNEVVANFPVILLLMFMVAGIHFMKDGLRLLFTILLVKVRSKIAISLLFCFLGAFLSAFLDALTVIAVIIAVAYGFYEMYTNSLNKEKIVDDENPDLDEFRGFLRNIMMHGAVGTALGGATTLVGEPQNLIIGKVAQWDFITFFIKCSVISIPVLIMGLLTCVLLETTKFGGYGRILPESVYKVLKNNVDKQISELDNKMKAKLISQAISALILIAGLALHVAEVGLVGLMIIILSTALTGVINEHDFGEAFTEALPFTALLVVFFAIVAVIHDLHLFSPIINSVLELEGKTQLVAFYFANGILSAISDNVFVATIYISEVEKVLNSGMLTKEWFDKIAVTINLGTNIPSVATPNGQAAFLFLLTSSLAPLIRLSYMQMVKLALPYAIVMTTTGALAVYFFL